MSGAFAGVPNAFANAVTATGLQLDQNNNTLTAYLNDPTNRNNYAADGSAGTNTVAITFAPPVVGGYTAGLELTWKWASTNTGGVQANANGLGLISVVNPDGSALGAGQGQAGSIGKAVYDGTRAVMISAPAVWTRQINTTLTVTVNAPIDISGASGGQIIFPATQNASSGANTLDDYEEGTWTPIDASGASLSITSFGGRYVKVGASLIVVTDFQYPVTASGANASIGGFPFANGSVASSIAVGYSSITNAVHTILLGADTTSQTFSADGTQQTNANVSAGRFRWGCAYQIN